MDLTINTSRRKLYALMVIILFITLTATQVSASKNPHTLRSIPQIRKAILNLFDRVEEIEEKVEDLQGGAGPPGPEGPEGPPGPEGSCSCDITYEAYLELVSAHEELAEDYEDLLARILALEGCVPDCEGKECGDDGCGGSCGQCEMGYYCDDGICVECPPGTADCDGDPENGCENEYLDPVSGCEDGVGLPITGDDPKIVIKSENHEATYLIHLSECAEPPGPPSNPSDLVMYVTLSPGPGSVYGLELYDAACNLLQENEEVLSWTVFDISGVDNSIEIYLKVVYVSGDPCEPWELTIRTGFPKYVEQEGQEGSNDEWQNAELVGFDCELSGCNPTLLIDGVLYDISGGYGSDYYEFYLPSDTELTIRTIQSQYQSEIVDTNINLYDDVGTLLASDDGSPYDIITENLVTGTYYISVTASETAGDGYYRFSLTLGASP